MFISLVGFSPRQIQASFQEDLWLIGQYEITEVIPSLVNESSSGSLHATGAIIIITAITYRSPPTSLGISVMLFFLLDDRRVAIPSLVKLIWFLGHDPAARRLR